MAEKKSSSLSNIETIDSEARLVKVVNKLYVNGSDNRSQKNGNPDALVKYILKQPHIATCGLYAHMKEFHNIINDKEARKRGTIDEKTNKTIAKFILDCYRSNKSDYYIHITEQGRNALEEIIEHGTPQNKQSRSIFQLHRIFSIQERQKVTPGKAK